MSGGECAWLTGDRRPHNFAKMPKTGPKVKWVLGGDPGPQLSVPHIWRVSGKSNAQHELAGESGKEKIPLWRDILRMPLPLSDRGVSYIRTIGEKDISICRVRDTASQYSQ